MTSTAEQHSFAGEDMSTAHCTATSTTTCTGTEDTAEERQQAMTTKPDKTPQSHKETISILDSLWDVVFEPEWCKAPDNPSQNYMKYHICDGSGANYLECHMESRHHSVGCGTNTPVPCALPISRTQPGGSTTPYLNIVMTGSNKYPFDRAQLRTIDDAHIANFKWKSVGSRIEVWDPTWDRMIYYAKVPCRLVCKAPIEFMIYSVKTGDVLGSFTLERTTCVARCFGLDKLNTSFPGYFNWQNKAMWLSIMLLYKLTLSGVEYSKMVDDRPAQMTPGENRY